MTDYGSGTLGDWSAMSHAVSTNWAQPRVAIVGDSITARGRTKLAAMLLAEFGTELAYDYWSSRPTAPAVDALLARGLWPEVLVMATGANDIFDPTVMPAQIQRVLDAAPQTTKVVWVDVQVCRTKQTTAIQLADQRLSMAVNAHIYGAFKSGKLAAVVPWAWTLAGASLAWRMAYYLEDGVHQWQAQGTSPYNHGNGVDFWAETVMKVLRPLLVA